MRFRHLFQKLKRLLSHDLFLVAILVFIIYCLRFASLFPTVWEWDSVLFAQGLIDYEVKAHHPHPPGYPYYIGLGKLFNIVTHAPDQALLLMTLLFGSLTCMPLFYLYRRSSDRLTAFLCVLLVQVCPIVWFMGERAMNDSVALFWLYWGLLVYFPLSTSWNRLVCGLAVLGFALGFRPQYLLIIIPILLHSIWFYLKARQIKLFLIVIIGFMLMNLAWSGIVIQNVGGLDQYMHICCIQAGHLVEAESLFQNEQVFQFHQRLKRFLIDIWAVDALGYAIMFLSVLGLIWHRRSSHSADLLTLGLIFSPAFVIMLFFQNAYILRYSLPFLPFIVFWAVNAFNRISKQVTGRSYAARVITVCVCLTYIVLMQIELKEIRQKPLPLESVLAQLPNKLTQQEQQDFIILADRHLKLHLETRFPEYKATIMVRENITDHNLLNDIRKHTYALFEGLRDIGHRPLSSARIKSKIIRKLSRNRYLNVSLVNESVILGAGWSHLYYDERIKRYGRMLEKQGEIFLLGLHNRNLLELEAYFRGDWPGQPPELVLQIDDRTPQSFWIAEPFFILRLFLEVPDCNDSLPHRATLLLRGPDANHSLDSNALFITEMVWQGSQDQGIY